MERQRGSLSLFLVMLSTRALSGLVKWHTHASPPGKKEETSSPVSYSLSFFVYSTRSPDGGRNDRRTAPGPLVARVIHPLLYSITI